MSDPYYIAPDGYGDLSIWEPGAQLFLRKCDLPPANRERAWDVIVGALGAEEHDHTFCEACGDLICEDCEHEAASCAHGRTICDSCWDFCQDCAREVAEEQRIYFATDGRLP